MKNIKSRLFFTLALFLNTEVTLAGKNKEEKKASPTIVSLKISLGDKKLDLKVPNPELAIKLQEAFKKGEALEIPFGSDVKESLEGYKGISEQEQRQMLCSDINSIIDLMVANSEATTVSKIDTKMQIEILMLKLLQEQIALNWAEQNLFKSEDSKVTIKEIQNALLTEIPVLIGTKSINDYFCNEATSHKAIDCKIIVKNKSGT